MRTAIAALLLCAFISGCERTTRGVGSNEVLTTGDESNYTVETIAARLEVPWAIAFTPDGLILITERPGRVRVIEKNVLRREPIAVIKGVEHAGESGLMDLILHPEYSQNRFVYISCVYEDAGSLRLRIARYRHQGTGFHFDRVIIDKIPAARFHSGCRMGFGPDGKLYITTGDAGQSELAQKLDSLAGKTLRLEDDGGIPADNPFASTEGARSEIWSYGHRNAQGLDWQPGTGLQFQSEHGPSGLDGPGGGDEINIIEKGKNYGWPVIHHRQTADQMITPLLEYTPAVAPASGRFYSGRAFPSFSGDFFVGCLRGEKIVRIRPDVRRIVQQEDMLKNRFGRIRAITIGPDGFIYFSTSNRDGRGSPTSDDDRILRIVPTGKQN